ncbi:MAG: hypothetical protein HN368_06825, partial [Spirochaetales bacterium]|nr:hypothetical protein [Spirochaetales bacterium]
MENIKICAAVLFLLIMSCDSLTPSAPAARFAIAETHQHDDGYTKYCRITVRVENIGTIPILRSTISIELKTDEAS